MKSRRMVLALVLVTGLLAAACAVPTSPAAKWCGVDTLVVPITIDSKTYNEIIIRPIRCPDPLAR